MRDVDDVGTLFAEERHGRRRRRFDPAQRRHSDDGDGGANANATLPGV